MGIQLQYEKSDDIPEMSVKELFAEKDGKMVFTGVEGLKTQSDIDKLNEALRKERNDHSLLKESMKKFDGVDLEEVRALKNKVISLEELTKNSSQSEESISAIVEKRLAIERADDLKKLEEANNRIGELESFKFGRELGEQIKSNLSDRIASEHQSTVSYILKNNSERQADGTYLLKDCSEFGLTSGMTLEQAVSKLSETNPVFAPKNTAGHGKGATGTTGAIKDPFSKENFSMTEQHKLYKENPAEYERLKNLSAG